MQRAPWALRWSQASATFLGAGVLLGVLLAHGTSWSYGSLIGAHLALNLAGWLGTAIVGTLHTFYPSLTQTQLRHPRLQRATYVLWLFGVLELAIGAAFTSRGVLAAGWTDLLAAAALLCANLAASLTAAPRPLTLPARLLTTAGAFLLAGLTVALLTTITAGVTGPLIGPSRAALATLLLTGWIGLTVTGSLLHLLAILTRIRGHGTEMPALHPRRDGAITTLAAAALAGLALAQLPALSSLTTPAAALTLVVGVLFASRVIALALHAILPSVRLPVTRTPTAG